MLRDARPHACARANWQVTAVLVDDVLIDVEPGDTTERRHGIAFDLGTTTVVATLLDLATGTPVAVASMLNRQQPFGADVISRISATMLDDDGPRAPAAAGARDARPSWRRRSARQGGVDAARGLRGRARRQRDDDPARAGHRPRAASASRRSSWPRATTPACAPPTSASPSTRARRPRVFPALGAYVGGDIVAGLLATRHEPRQAAAPVHRRRHELRDRARLAGPHPHDGGAGRPGLRGGADPLRHARRRRAPSRSCKIDGGALNLGVIGDVEPVGVCGSGLVDAVAELAKCGLLDRSGRLARRRDRRPSIAPGARPTASWRWRAASASSCCTGGQEGDLEGAVYLSQRDVRELQFAKAVDRHRLALLVRGARHRAPRHPAGAARRARSAPTSRRPAPSASASCRSCRCCASSRRATSPARARRWRSSRCRSGTRAEALLEEVEYVELSDRPDFNDRFVEQLALPG